MPAPKTAVAAPYHPDAAQLLAEHAGIERRAVAPLLEKYGSMAAMLDCVPKDGKHIRRFKLRELTEAEQSIADSEALDPEHPEEMLRFYNRRGLFRGRLFRQPGKLGNR